MADYNGQPTASRNQNFDCRKQLIPQIYPTKSSLISKLAEPATQGQRPLQNDAKPSDLKTTTRTKETKYLRHQLILEHQSGHSDRFLLSERELRET